MLTRLRALGRHGKPGDLQKVRLRYSPRSKRSSNSSVLIWSRLPCVDQCRDPGPMRKHSGRTIYAEYSTASMRPTHNERKTAFPKVGTTALAQASLGACPTPQPFGSTASPTTNSRASRRYVARAWRTPLREQSGYWSRRPSGTTSRRPFAMTNTPGWTLTPAEGSQTGRPARHAAPQQPAKLRGGTCARGPRVR